MFSIPAFSVDSSVRVERSNNCNDFGRDLRDFGKRNADDSEITNLCLLESAMCDKLPTESPKIKADFQERVTGLIAFFSWRSFNNG
jgi:hypothetical protein